MNKTHKQKTKTRFPGVVLITLISLFPLSSPLAQERAMDVSRPAALEEDIKTAPSETVAGMKATAAERPDEKGSPEAMSEIRQSLRLLRERQADIGADMTNLAEQVQKLRGELEALNNPERLKEDRRTIQAALDDLSARIRVLENLLGTGQTEPTKKDIKKDESTMSWFTDVVKAGKPDLKESYNDAFGDFKQGRYDEARKKFQAFLKQFPEASLASGAQFWIGESYYMEGNIEKAILEYDKVIVNYPKGEMVPHALLKQGLSFIKIGDKTGAKILLEKLSHEYPDTHQAQLARGTLETLK